MKLLKKKEKEKEEPEEKEKRVKTRKNQQVALDKPRDPTRWFSLLFLLIFLFLSYLSWVAYK